MTTESEYKLINELRVTELKAELDKRGLDKTGIKTFLLDRLEKALKSEGHDPATFKFTFNETGKKVGTPVKIKEELKPFAEGEADTHREDEVDKIEEKEEQMDTEESSKAETLANDINCIENHGEEEQLEDPLNEPQTEKKSPEQNQSTTENAPTENDPRCIFWVRGLPAATKAAELKEHFGQFGHIVRTKIFTSKKDAKQAFGLVVVSEPETADASYDAQHNKLWKGVTLTIEKGTSNIKTFSKTTAAVNIPVKKDKISSKDETKKEEKKDEKKANSKSVIKSAERRSTDEKDRERRDDRNRSRRDPHPAIREASRQRDSYNTIGAARRPDSISHHSSSRISRAQPPPISSRLSRPSAMLPRRVESYRRSDSDRSHHRERHREEELRLRAEQLELEREKARIRADKEKLERQRLEIELEKKQQQIAALQRATHQSPRSHLDDTRHSSSHSRREEDKYSSSRSGDSHRNSERSGGRGRERERERPPRVDDRRPPAAINIDRSRSRHDSHREPAHRDSRYIEPRRESRHEVPASRSIPSSFSNGKNYSSRDAPTSATGQTNYGYREYSSGVLTNRTYDHGARVAPATESWSNSNGNWTSAPADNNWTSAKSSSADWGYGSNQSNVRIDYDKYHRSQRGGAF